MSNQFFNYIAKYIANFFYKRKVEPGERFYLRLDSTADVHAFKNAIHDQVQIDSFRFPLAQGEYLTDEIPVSNGLVLAYNNEEVSTDFMVTLRNRVSDQKDVFIGKALLSVISNDLDSITGGSISLKAEGMPLNPSMLSTQIKNDIKEAILERTDQIILQEYIDELDRERKSHFINFYDFQDALKILHEGSLQTDDYMKMGLFKDPHLGEYSGVNQKKRLEENRNLFSITKAINDNNLDRSELEKHFTQRIAGDLAKTDWHEVPFDVVKKAHEERKQQNKKTVVALKELKVEGAKGYLVRNPSESAAGLRKHHIIVFSGEHEITLTANLEIKFSEKPTINASHVSTRKNKNIHVDIKRTNIQIKSTGAVTEPEFEKIVYKHEKNNNLSVELHLVILPFNEMMFEKYKHSYIINSLRKRIQLPLENDVVQLGEDTLELKEHKLAVSDETIQINENETLVVEIHDDLYNSDEEIEFNVQQGPASVKIHLEGEPNNILPRSLSAINSLVRQKNITFDYSEGIVSGGQYQFSLSANDRTTVERELKWVSEGLRFGLYQHGVIVENTDLAVKDTLKESYSRFLNSFQGKSPTLTAWNESIIEKAEEYVQSAIDTIKAFESNQSAGSSALGVFYLGTIKTEDEIWLTPFHPINVAYKLQELKELRDEEIENAIYDRLKPDALLPYLFGPENVVFSPEQQIKTPGWITFKKKDTSNVADANLYLNKVVADKLKQFKKHYNYYFSKSVKAPFKIQVINILNDYQVLRGIFQWYVQELSHDLEAPPLLDVLVIRSSVGDSWIEKFATIRTAEEFQEVFDVKLKITNKNAQADVSDNEVFKTIQKNVQFRFESDLSNVEYSHIVFYKMHTAQRIAVQEMNLMESGLSMEGLYSSTPSKKFQEDYRSGFGAEDLRLSNLLKETAYYFNELAANLENNSRNSYIKNRGIVSITSYDDKEVIANILSKPVWATFIDPGVELDFFEQLHKDLVIIHYNDQYSSSSRYDAVTVTSRSQQFNRVIEDYLSSVDIQTKHDRNDVEKIISSFNTINGEWLLKIVGSKGYFTKEKLSIIAAIKATTAYLANEDIIWVPISLEEVLRVAGAANLNRKNGIFTAKNLGVTGQHSDDLLFIGLSRKEEQLKFYLYPIEVKVGINDQGVTAKAEAQLAKTIALLEEELIHKEDSFTKRFHQNFFAQLFISNLKRIMETGFGDLNDYKLSSEDMMKIKQGNFVYDTSLEPIIGKGAVFSFTKELTHRTNRLENTMLKINFLEEDVKKCLLNPQDDLKTWLIGEQTELIKEHILKYELNPTKETTSTDYSKLILNKISANKNDRAD